MLPEFGSEVVDLIDAPMTPQNILRLYAATIEAVDRWEPRLEVEKVNIQSVDANGVIRLSLTGLYEDRSILIESIPIGASLPEPETTGEVIGTLYDTGDGLSTINGTLYFL